MKSIVVVSSLTGNTLKVASAVAYGLDDNLEAVKVEENPDVSDYDLVVIGTWIDRGTADAKAQEFIKTIKNKKVAVFTTLGAYPDSDHAKKCLDNISKLFVGKSIYQLLLQHGFHFNENIRRRFLWQKAKKHEQPLRRLITKNHGNICRVNG